MRWLRPKNVFSEVIGGDDSCCLGGDEHVGGQGGGLRRSPGRSPISFYRTLLYIILHIYLQKCTVIWFSDTITKMQEIRTQNSFGFDSTNTQGHAIPHLNMMLCPFWVLFSKRLSLWTCIRSQQQEACWHNVYFDTFPTKYNCWDCYFDLEGSKACLIDCQNKTVKLGSGEQNLTYWAWID